MPIGLAVSLNTALLQALVQLDSPRDEERAVLVVYATVTTIVTPLGGLLIGAAADMASLWWALAGCGLVLTILALSLRNRLTVFDPFDQQGATAPSRCRDITWRSRISRAQSCSTTRSRSSTLATIPAVRQRINDRGHTTSDLKSAEPH